MINLLAMLVLLVVSIALVLIFGVVMVAALNAVAGFITSRLAERNLDSAP